MSQGQLRGPAPVRVVFDGQSLNYTPAAPYNVPTRVMSGRHIPWTSVGIGGNGWFDLATTAATRLFPQVRDIAGCTDILIMNGGQGDFLNAAPSGQQSGATCYSRAVSYANAARAAGFDKIIITTHPAMGPDMLGTGRPTPLEATSLADYNTLVLANSGGFDAIADTSVAPLNDATNTTYFDIDRLHFLAPGAQAAADIISIQLDIILATL